VPGGESSTSDRSGSEYISAGEQSLPRSENASRGFGLGPGEGRAAAAARRRPSRGKEMKRGEHHLQAKDQGHPLRAGGGG